MHRVVLIAVLTAALVPALASSAGAAGSKRNSGYYDHQIIQYTLSNIQASSPAAARQIAKGLVVYHMVDSSGQTPAVQCARLLQTLPNDATACNTLNKIPTEVGYTGGSWNLQIFHWNPGQTPVELSSDDDVLAAVAAGKGWLEHTNLLIRCPVNDFSLLR
jgi:hypothetical protein